MILSDAQRRSAALGIRKDMRRNEIDKIRNEKKRSAGEEEHAIIVLHESASFLRH